MNNSEAVKQIKRRRRLQDDRRERLFARMKANEALIRDIHERYSLGHEYEDRMYRFYHASLKVFWLQDGITETMKLLHKLSPHRKHEFDKWFLQIIKDAQDEGLFKKEYNKDFPKHARPVVEGYLHCKYFLDMFVECLKLDKEPKPVIPSGWACILELYNLR